MVDKMKDLSKKLNIKILRNLKIGNKYLLSLGAVFLLFGISAAIVTTLIINIGNNMDALERRGDRAIAISDMNTLTQSMGLSVANYVHYSTSSFLSDFENQYDQFNTLLDGIENEMSIYMTE